MSYDCDPHSQGSHINAWISQGKSKHNISIAVLSCRNKTWSISFLDLQHNWREWILCNVICDQNCTSVSEFYLQDLLEWSKKSRLKREYKMEKSEKEIKSECLSVSPWFGAASACLYGYTNAPPLWTVERQIVPWVPRPESVFTYRNGSIL